MKSQLLLSRILMTLFALIALFAVLSAFSDLSLIAYCREIASGGLVDDARAAGIDAFQGLVSLIQLAIELLTIVVFLVWFYRAHKNLSEAGLERLRYSPGWAVGGFFVPFLNLVRPYQVMSEVWAGSAFLASEEEEKEKLKSWQRARVPALVGAWWGLFLCRGVIGRISAGVSSAADEPAELLTAGWVSFAAGGVEIAAGILALVLVLRLSALQQAAVPRIDTDHEWPQYA